MKPLRNPPLKRCPVCETEKPAAAFYRNASTYSGLSSLCKVCSDACKKAGRKPRVNARRQANEAEYEALEFTHQVCTGCGERKHKTEFYLHRGSGRRVPLATQCKVCAKFKQLERVTEKERQAALAALDAEREKERKIARELVRRREQAAYVREQRASRPHP